MAIARKGSRLITVGGFEYRWAVSPDDEPGLGLVVELADNPGQRMVAWIEHGNEITPRIVELAIIAALEQDWNPSERGRELRFRVEGDCCRHADHLSVRAS